jgi:hypothetical protein
MIQEKQQRSGSSQSTAALQHVNQAIVRHWQRKLSREGVRLERLTTAKADAK